MHQDRRHVIDLSARSILWKCAGKTAVLYAHQITGRGRCRWFDFFRPRRASAAQKHTSCQYEQGAYSFASLHGLTSTKTGYSPR